MAYVMSTQSWPFQLRDENAGRCAARGRFRLCARRQVVKHRGPPINALHAGIERTRGCIAVTDGEMEEIFKRVPDAALVEIRP